MAHKFVSNIFENHIVEARLLEKSRKRNSGYLYVKYAEYKDTFWESKLRFLQFVNLPS